MDAIGVNNYESYKQQPALLTLTGATRGVQGAGYTPTEFTGGVVDITTNVPTRAVDKLPKAELVNYTEYLPSQGGYVAGYSHRTLIA